VPVKKFWKSVNIWRTYGQKFAAYFLGLPCIYPTNLDWTHSHSCYMLRSVNTFILDEDDVVCTVAGVSQPTTSERKSSMTTSSLFRYNAIEQRAQRPLSVSVQSRSTTEPCLPSLLGLYLSLVIGSGLIISAWSREVGKVAHERGC